MPDDDRPLAGWVNYELRPPNVIPCVRCGVIVDRGIVQVNMRGKEGTEGFRVMCRPCYEEIMSPQAAELEAKRGRMALPDGTGPWA